ncbi:MAG: sigma-70 family RNA polymerase sigma factor [Ruminococcaceae bacterium]|nr:sigma-70 family RNA polymerase sigma factor [Oscillospiraceae bacterium]
MSDIAKNKEIQELIFRVRKGDDVAFSELLSRYTPLIEGSLLRSLGDEFYGLYSEDLRQEATMVFYNSILTYDVEQHEVEFGLYAKICITNALISQKRLLMRRRGESLSENDLGELFGDSEQDPSAIVMEQESLRALDSLIRGSLSDLEYRIWCLYMSGKTASEISLSVGKSSKSVNNAIYRIRRKLRASLQ